ncbi:response regulator [Methylobacterium aerolatum]|uniref:DNA-binding NarL/FixJ family response regulator n=1 Tax=Methylobacterium aerolatum TaxID=418708 RepID=A0ABU0I281_9HYPH|nr:response regulator transcription factor [Methylobacterium aerolatum]MDQ0448704.1 DNA-binding NarL/FixJ family response regulator [Methylobacterium aerolatum]
MTIAIVDDHPVMRQGLVAVIAEEKRFSVVAEGANAGDAVRIAAQARPDIMLLDLRMPGGGLEALSIIAAASPEVACIMFTGIESSDSAMEAMRRGAKGYVLKGVSAVDLRATIWTVYNNGSYILPAFARRIFAAEASERSATAKDKGLTLREAQILDQVALGHSNKLIAAKLGLSEKTVKHYMTSLMAKLMVSNRVAAAMKHQKNSHENP